MRLSIKFIMMAVVLVMFLWACGGKKAANEQDLGGGTNWSKWVLAKESRIDGNSLVLPRGADGFLPFDADLLYGKRLAYSVAGTDGANCRWQINWHDKKDKFIKADIAVYAISNGIAVYEKEIDVPVSAAVGYIYASRHGDHKADMVFKRIYLVGTNN